MIGVDNLLYDIDLKLNKLASGRHQGISDEDKIIALNDAQLQLIKQKVGLNNNYKAGIDSFNKRYDDLQSLIITDKQIAPLKITDFKYAASLESVPDYLFYISAALLADNGYCQDHKLDIQLVPHADVPEWLGNVHLAPSFIYQETIATLSSRNLEVYTDGDFIPTQMLLTYLRYPQSIDISGYIHFDGTASVNKDSELNAYLKDELVDLAVMEIAMSTENINAVQLTGQRIQQNE